MGSWGIDNAKVVPHVACHRAIDVLLLCESGAVLCDLQRHKSTIFSRDQRSLIVRGCPYCSFDCGSGAFCRARRSDHRRRRAFEENVTWSGSLQIHGSDFGTAALHRQRLTLKANVCPVDKHLHDRRSDHRQGKGADVQLRHVLQGHRHGHLQKALEDRCSLRDELWVAQAKACGVGSQ